MARPGKVPNMSKFRTKKKTTQGPPGVNKGKKPEVTGRGA